MCGFFFFFEEEEKPDNKLWRPEIRAEFLSCGWDNTGEDVVHQEGLVLGMLPWGQGRSPHLLPAWDNCIFPNMLTFVGFPLAKPWCGIAGLSVTVPWEGNLLQRERRHSHLLQAQQEFWNNTRKQGKYHDTWSKHHFLLKPWAVANLVLTASVWDAREFKINYWEAFYFSHRKKKKSQNKSPEHQQFDSKSNPQFSVSLNGRENIRKRFHFERPKRLFQTIPRKNIAEVPRIRGVLHLLIFMVSHWSCWYLTLALKS